MLFPCWELLGQVHPRRPRGSQSGRKRRDESLQVGAREPLGTDSHRTISKNSNGCRLLIGHKKCFVLLWPIGEQFLLSFFVSSYTTAIFLLHLPGSFTKLVRARETFIFYFPNKKRRNYRWVEEAFGMLSAGAIEFGPNILFLTDHSVFVNNRKFKMRRRRESQISNSLTR